MHIMKQGMQLLVTRLSWILRVQCFAEVMQEFPQWQDGYPNPERVTIMYAGTIALSMLCEQQGWKYERWRGIDKADFDNIYLWSIEMYGDDDE
jgi:hypothetical protein